MDRGDITLNGVPYKIDMGSFSWPSMSDFAPKTSVPGGGQTFSDLTLYQSLNITDWQHGFGFQWFTDPSGYLRTEGNVDTRHDGIAILYTSACASDTSNAVKEGFGSFKNKWYGYGAGGLREYTVAGGWTELISSGSPANFLLPTSKYLFYFPDNKRPLYAETPGVIAATTYATFTTSFGSHKDLKFTAATSGSAGNNVTIAYTLPGGIAAGSEVVTVSNNDVSVAIGADSTAIHIMNAILHDVSASATLVTKLSGANNDVKYTAVTAGEGGNLISITYTYSKTLAKDGETVTVSGNAITVNTGKTTTANRVIAVIQLSSAASALVTVANYGDSTGNGHLPHKSMAQSFLTNGSTESAAKLLTVSIPTGQNGSGKPNSALSKTNLANGAGTFYWNTTGVNDDAKDFKWAAIHNGEVYAGEDGNNYVHYASETDLSDLEADGEEDPTVIKVGTGEIPTIGGLEFAGNMYVTKPDGLWQIGDDKIARKVLDYQAEMSTENFRSFAIHQSFLIFPIRDKIVQWNGSRVVNITPKRLTDTFPYTTYGRFDNFVTVGDYLFITARTNEASYTESLLCWDGVAWFRMCDLCTSGTGTITAMAYDSINNRLWYHKDTTADTTYCIPFQAQSVFPYASFPTGTGNAVITSRIDMGYRRVAKESPSILIEASNLSAGHRYISVYYAIDGGSWTAWNDVTTTNNNVTANGITELILATPINYKHLLLKFELVTDSTAQTPVLEGATLRFLMRPDVFDGWNFTVIVEAGNISDGSVDMRQPKEILTDLATARDLKTPITFVDPYGDSHTVYMTNLVRKGANYMPTPNESANIAGIAQVTLVERR